MTKFRGSSTLGIQSQYERKMHALRVTNMTKVPAVSLGTQETFSAGSGIGNLEHDSDGTRKENSR